MLAFGQIQLVLWQDLASAGRHVHTGTVRLKLSDVDPVLGTTPVATFLLKVYVWVKIPAMELARAPFLEVEIINMVIDILVPILATELKPVPEQKSKETLCDW